VRILTTQTLTKQNEGLKKMLLLQPTNFLPKIKKEYVLRTVNIKSEECVKYVEREAKEHRFRLKKERPINY
jgi:hypothetical protein